MASVPITDYWLSGVIPVPWPWCGSPALFVQEGCGLLRDLGKHFLFPMAWKGQVLEELWPEWGGLCSCKELGQLGGGGSPRMGLFPSQSWGARAGLLEGGGGAGWQERFLMPAGSSGLHGP